MATIQPNTKPTLRRFRDGDGTWKVIQDKIHDAGYSHQCPTYIVAAPPCQAGCPAGEDIRGYMNIVRGIDKPPVGADGKPTMPWQEYAFRRITEANPFPAIMGRCCPAPCQDGCNRAKVEERVAINSVEHFVGNYAIEKGLAFAKPAKETGKRIAVIGGGVGGLSCAYHLRRKGHAVVVFEAYGKLGGMMAFGLPSYRADHAVVDKEVKRILDMGVEARLNTRVGKDVSFESLKREFDAIFVAIGAQSGNRLDIPGADAPNCIDGLKFLREFNEGKLADITGPVVVIGGGNTAMDVASVALRSGIVKQGKRQSGEVLIAYRRTIPEMPADEIEINGVLREGGKIQTHVIPVSMVKGADGKATALRVAKVEWVNKKMVVKPGTEYDIPCALIIAATGQSVEWQDMAGLKNAKNLANIDGSFQATGTPGVFIGGDAVVPDLLTTAIGHGRIAAEGIDDYVSGRPIAKRPKVDKTPFDVPSRMVVKLETAREPMRGTAQSNVAVHNYDNRSDREIVGPELLFLGHFNYVPANVRELKKIDVANVLGNMDERLIALSEAQVQAEAKRCMSCGLCLECDNCVIYCPQETVKKVPKAQASIGRYVYTEYANCIGCGICADVCPTGYIRMGFGE